MPTTDSSPRITHVSWGRLEVEPPSDDGPQSFKDAKLYPGGARAWDWNETGTSHTPGIQPADVEELLEHGASVVVLSRGMNQRLQVKPETLDRLDDAGVDVHVAPTDRAVEQYNELQAADEAVAGLFHSTC
ncbi:MAG: Mth938-like domain-containing protein [Salinibacter sp.]|uniref:Mth938-like domain-containing protein n=1 Tax=Salinibacter sp. TaxID=2065818 RepID=UPI002FC33F5A